MCISESTETYLEAIYSLSKHKGNVHAIDIATYLNYSKASVSVAVKDLKQRSLINVSTHNTIPLTDAGLKIASQMNERHCFFYSLLTQSGMEQKDADLDAHKLMHAISIEGFQKIKQLIYHPSLPIK